MFKRIGVLALTLSSIGMAILPTAAFAQDGYYRHRDYYYQGDRDGDRHGGWHSRDGQWRGWGWGNPDWRERREWREHEWREHEWRERQHWNNGFYRDGYPGTYYYFWYGR